MVLEENTRCTACLDPRLAPHVLPSTVRLPARKKDHEGVVYRHGHLLAALGTDLRAYWIGNHERISSAFDPRKTQNFGRADWTGTISVQNKTPLCESPIAFLAHKYQHFVVAHRILRNQQSKTDSCNPRESYAGVSHAHIHTGRFATVNLLVLSAFILLPEEVQGILLDDFLSVCTILCVMMLKGLKDLTVASLVIAIGMCGILLGIIYACTRGHKSTGRATESVQSTHSERNLNRDRTDHEEFLELGHDDAVAHADTDPSGGGRSTQPTDGRVGAPSNSGYFAAQI